MSLKVEVILQGPSSRPVPVGTLGDPVRRDILSWGRVTFRNKDYRSFDEALVKLDNLDELAIDVAARRLTVVLKSSLTAPLVRQFGELVETHRKQSKVKKTKKAEAAE